MTLLKLKYIVIVSMLVLLTTVSYAQSNVRTLTTCDATELVSAIVTANTSSTIDTVELKAGCEYILASAYETTMTTIGSLGETGLPSTSRDLTINGNGSTIMRDESAPEFRIMVARSDTKLTLNNVTIKNGFANGLNFAGGNGGGAVWIGGAADLEVNNSNFINNAGGTEGFLVFGGAILSEFTFVGGVPNSNVVVTNSVFQNNRASDGAAINVRGNLTITGSKFIDNISTSNNTAAVSVTPAEVATNEWKINDSCFVNNEELGVRNDGLNSPSVDATNNWWGSADGPSGDGPGNGDAINNDVIFEPFKTTDDLNCGIREGGVGSVQPPIVENNDDDDDDNDAPIIPSPIPDLPLTTELAALTNGAITASGAGGNNFSVFGTVIVQDGQYAPGKSLANIGDVFFTDKNILQALDVYALDGNGTPILTQTGAIQVCLRGQGSIYFMSATAQPRVVQLIAGNFTGGYTCGVIPTAGVVVLIS